MHRLVALVLVGSMGGVTTAFAGDSILTSGTRLVRQLAVEAAASVPAATVVSRPDAAQRHQSSMAYQAEGGRLSQSQMGKGKKALIYIGLAVGFAASAWTIDHRVSDSTPSSLGTRKD